MWFVAIYKVLNAIWEILVCSYSYNEIKYEILPIKGQCMWKREEACEEAAYNMTHKINIYYVASYNIEMQDIVTCMHG